MKYSIYNNFIDLTDTVKAVYNSASDSFVLIKGEGENWLNNPPVELRRLNEDLYNELCGGGAIVSNAEDEYKKQLRNSQKIRLESRVFHLMINPTLDCNLRCWYCYEKHVKGSSISSDIMNGILGLISRKCIEQRNIEKLILSFFGGEPLLEFDSVRKIILHSLVCCKKKNIALGVSFTSNGVLINDEMVSFFKENKLDVTFQITLDGAQEEHNKTRYTKGNVGTYDIIIRNIHCLLENQIPVILRINYTANNFSSILSILNDIKKWKEENRRYVKVDLQRIWQDGAKELEIGPTMKLFREGGFEVTSPLLDLDYLHNPCYADNANQLLINYNGDVYKCTARDFSKESRLGILKDDGSVVWMQDTPKNRITNILPHQICSTCSIFPLCGGGCIQKRQEQKDNVCIYGIDEQKKQDIILNRFYNYVVKKQVQIPTN